VNPFPAPPPLGEFDHLLQVVADPSSRLVRGCSVNTVTPLCLRAASPSLL
jgi:hypothetical protein